MSASPHINILLIEDNPGDIRIARETLKDYKVQNAVATVADGEAALRYLRRQVPYENALRPDMILLDVNLPKIDGLEVLEEMRRDPSLSDIPLALLTASDIEAEFLRRHNIQTDCYVEKPLTLERFLEAMRCFPQFGLSIVRVTPN